MKIVYIAEWYPYMSAKVTHAIAKRLVAMGCNVVVITSGIDLNGRRGLLPFDEEIDGVTVRRIDATRLTTSTVPYVVYNPISVAARTTDIVRELEEADIIHSQTIHGMLNIGINSLLVTKRHTSKLVIGSHGVPSYNSLGTWIGCGVWNFLMKQIATKSRLVITVARSSIPALVRLGIAPERIRYIPNGVDSSGFSPSTSSRQTLRRNLGWAEDDVLVLSLGQIRAAKGIPVLLQALPRVLGSHPRVKVVIAGSGPMAPHVMRWRDLQVADTRDRVRLVPRNITERELPYFFGASDIFVLPSYWEGFPLTLLEAMSCGACPVATRVGDVPEIIRHGVNGYLFDPGDSQELASLVSRLALDGALRRSMCKASLQTAQLYDWENIAKQYYESYASLAS